MDSNRYKQAKEKYSDLGVNTEQAINILKNIPISMNAWQLDDVSGFEVGDSAMAGAGILATGSYPGKAKRIDEMWSDLEIVLKLVPGTKKVSIQSSEGDYKGNLKDKLAISKDHFISWIEWAKENNTAIDLGATLYSHPKADSGYTLSSKDDSIRMYWVEYVKKVREISDFIGNKIGIPCISALWILDGSKDITPSRYDHRIQLISSLNEIYKKKYPKNNLIDSLESKLFGIGLEYFNTGSLELYLSYAVKNNLGLTLDMGHLHPTETVSDKISSILPYLDNLILHLTRGIRWDSDHVVTLSEELINIMQEVVRADSLSKIHLGTDYFDSSINRVGALALGTRNVSRAMLTALLEPTQIIKDFEDKGNNFARLTILESLKNMPVGDVWDHYCNVSNTPTDMELIEEITRYETETERFK